jgi:hypothetical protein
MLSREAIYTNIYYIVCDLTRAGLEPTIYCTRSKHANHYTTTEVDCEMKISNYIFCISCYLIHNYLFLLWIIIHNHVHLYSFVINLLKAWKVHLYVGKNNVFQCFGKHIPIKVHVKKLDNQIIRRQIFVLFLAF